MVENSRHEILYGRQLSMTQPQLQVDEIVLAEELNEINSWFNFSVINTVMFLPLIFWIIPLHDSVKVELLKKQKLLTEAQTLSKKAFQVNIYVTALGLFTYAWLIPSIVFILISNQNS